MSAARSHGPDPVVRSSAEETALLSSLLAVRGFGVFSIDREGKIAEVNGAAEEILAARAAELVGRSPDEFCRLSLNDVRLPIDRNPSVIVRRTGAPHDAGVLKVTRLDDSHRWVRVEAVPLLNAAGVVEHVLVMLTDVTSAHDGEDALRLERQRVARAGDRFRRVLESVPDAIAVYSERRVGYANAALVSLLGHPSVADLVGREIERVLPGHEPVAGRPGARPELREESWRCVDGSLAVVEVREHGFDLDGEPGTLLIARDISERKRAQMEVVQSSRLAAVGTLAAGVAHEINNPLTYVVANLELLTEDLGRLSNVIPTGRLANLLAMTDDARAGAESVRKIVRGLKAFSRADEERRVTLDVTSVMDVSIDMSFNEIRHRARLIKDYGPTPAIAADEGRLRQVFINLLVNAAQAIPAGNVDANQIRVVTRIDAKGRAVIEVQDSGEGIPQERLGRIFDPFFTTKPIGVGTGLGLSICHGLVSELGGELQVDSEVGVGTIFRVVLPPSMEDLRPLPPPAIDVATTARHARVLVIDDDASVAEVVRRVLTCEHDVFVVNDARAGLERIRAGETFDVVLCDLMMPEMTGMSFFAELEIAAPALCEHVVFITGGAFSPEAGAFLDRVPNQRLDKPFDCALLRDVVRRFAPAPD